MTEPTPISSTGSRDGLRARIEAAERRNADRTLADQAREAATAAVDYTRANPLTVIGGALAAGLVIGLLTRPGRRVASRVAHSTADAISGAASSASSGVRNVTSGGGSRFGQMIGQAAVTYAMAMIDEVLETARAGQERAEELGDAAGLQAKKITARTSDAAGSAADSTRALARKTRAAAADIVRDLSRKTKA
jgi:hypothetical protein